MQLAGRIALVTGSGSGIGRGCAVELAARGAAVVVNDRPGAGLAETTAAEIRAAGHDATAIEADAFDRSGCEKLVRQTLEQRRRIDILVACPAWSIRKLLVDYDPDEFLRTVHGTFVAYFHIAQLVARHMIGRGGGGKIVFISSIRSFLPFAKSAPYNASKAAVNQMAFTLANELAPHRINVNVIEPGWTDTPGERQFATEEQLAAMAKQLPWGRLATPTDIGRTAAFLCSDDADYITAASLRVDGGLWIRNLIR